MTALRFLAGAVGVYVGCFLCGFLAAALNHADEKVVETWPTVLAEAALGGGIVFAVVALAYGAFILVVLAWDL